MIIIKKAFFLRQSQHFARDDAMRDALAVSYQLFQFMATVSRGSWSYFTGRRKTSLFSYFLAKILTTSARGDFVKGDKNRLDTAVHSGLKYLKRSQNNLSEWSERIKFSRSNNVLGIFAKYIAGQFPNLVTLSDLENFTNARFARTLVFFVSNTDSFG